MSQPGIAAFTQRVTRRTTRQKAALLDNDNSNIVSISTKLEKKALVPSSPRKTQKAPELHESSPAKIKKPNKDEDKPKSRRGRPKKEPTPPPPKNNGETIQAAFRRQLEGLKSPTKRTPTTPDKFKINPIDITPPKEKLPTIRRALKFDKAEPVPEEMKTTAIIDSGLKPVMGGSVKRDRPQNSQPNSPSTASPHLKKRNLFDEKPPPSPMSTKELLLSPKKPTASPLSSPKKIEAKSRAALMLEKATGKKNLSVDLLKKNLAKSGKLNDLKAKLAEVKKIDDELRQIGSPKKKSTLAQNERSGPAPTALAADAPCYVKYRHLADPEAMEKMKLPSHYDLLYQQFETGDRTVSTLYNRGEACVFNKISLAVRQVLSRDFGAKQLEQIMAVTPDSYQIRWKKGLYDGKRGSSRIKSSEHQLVLQPILENDENDDCEGAIRMSLKHLSKRSKSFRQTLLGIVKSYHEEFCLSKGIAASKLANLKRWHPSFKLEECEPIKQAKLPEKPGAADSTLTANQLLDKMRDKMPDKAKAKFEERKKELELIELAKIKKEEEEAKSSTTVAAPTNKPKIPAHILAKIRAKQAAKAEQIAEDKVENVEEIDLLKKAPKAALMLRSYYVTERKICFPFDSACKKIQRSWKVPISTDDVGEMLSKVAEVMPHWIEVKTVVGCKYIKMLDKKLDPNLIESTCAEKIKSLKPIKT